MSFSDRAQELDKQIREAVDRAVRELRGEISRRLEEDHGRLLEELGGTDTALAGPILREEDLAPLVEEAAQRSRNEALDALHGAFSAIDRARSQTEVLEALLAGAGQFASRSALFLLRGEEIRGWAGHGFGDSESALRGIELPLAEESGWARLARGRGAVKLRSADRVELASRLESPVPQEAILLPLVLRDRVAAALYTDRVGEGGEIRLQALEVLAFTAALAIETLPFRERASTPTLRLEDEAPGEEPGLERWPHSAAAPAAAEEPAPVATETAAEEPYPIPPASPEVAVEATPPAPEPAPQEESGATEELLELPSPAAGETEQAAAEAADVLEETAAEPSFPRAEPGPSGELGDVELGGTALGDIQLGDVELGDVELEDVELEDVELEVEDSPLAPVAPVAETQPERPEPTPEPARLSEQAEQAEQPEQAEPPHEEEAQQAEPASADEPAEQSAPAAAAPLPPPVPTPGLRAVEQLPAAEEAAPAPEPVAEPTAEPRPQPRFGTPSATPTEVPQPAQPAPAPGGPQVQPPADVEGPGWAFTGGREQGAEHDEPAHEEARRLARLLVSEIKLYNEEEVQEGRRSQDVYERLKEDIDRSRQLYDERVDSDVRESTDYFYQELVRVLGAGDPKALGI